MTTELTNNALSVEVPDDASGYKQIPDAIQFDIKYGLGVVYVELPPGNWQILGLSTEITEEQAKLIVSKHYSGLGYDDYLNDVEFAVLETALESFESLIQSKGLDKSKKHLILIRQ